MFTGFHTFNCRIKMYSGRGTNTHNIYFRNPEHFIQTIIRSTIMLIRKRLRFVFIDTIYTIQLCISIDLIASA